VPITLAKEKCADGSSQSSFGISKEQLEALAEEPASPAFAPGSTVGGIYEILKPLGMGSSGVVYLCNRKDLNNHLIAMKVFSARSSSRAIDRERFKREILAAYQVNHPNVIRCYEYLANERFAAYTMEYLPGGNLTDVIDSEKPLEYKSIVSILSSICAGLTAIHEAGIVHRDLKPENVLVTAEGNIKISDFGVALMTRNTQLNTNGVLGTIEYISPEYMEFGNVDHRSDIFSLGVIAYEMITGNIPFEGETPIQTLCLRLMQDAKPLQFYRQDCPILLSKIVSKALARDPNNRYQSALEMKKDLELLNRVLTERIEIKLHPKSERENAKTKVETIEATRPTKPSNQPQSTRLRRRRQQRVSDTFPLKELLLKSIFVGVGTFSVLWISTHFLLG
jgi:serine/threonine protein kinase